jgi:hypothetical protein
MRASVKLLLVLWFRHAIYTKENKILTTLMLWDFQMKERIVEMITEVRGAPADIQKSFGFLAL